ncbi:FAD-binding and (Fe-S)-binding domain-containing protein [Salinibacterium soli]|uniref:D-lactate dehydrogenase (cytochrome) n=1 Tax=Antiquaquibacter soli TaxID=3064523 RepID=A0ABT9BI35_9MICO|nr:FAD-binding and (Fe-S)-binding domain-containing protein [Protaetiibacter sp. WY-16]MDO7880684.1 FAD-binding and (Fe-S)-binding domain-containing protein [Protaetiibacter sp. WY-16]
MSRTDIAPTDALGASIRSATAATVSTTAFDRVTAAVDASHYLLTPRAVVTPKSVEEVAELFSFATVTGEALTFRSGGTSLSGQASSGGILVDTRSEFRGIRVLDGGERVEVEPGVTVRAVNARLLRHKRKLGPDPASEIACTIGGVIANNSSGMACGTEQNTYRTLESAVIVLPSGTVVDTAAPDADDALRAREPGLYDTLLDLRERLLADPALRETVERQFSIKNTMGYGLNSLVDFERPVDMLLHLLVGSEGTLGFVARATFRTVPLQPAVATALLLFESLRAATDSLVELVASGAATIELLDAASLRVAQADPSSVGALPELEVVDHAALLVEYQAASVVELDALAAGARTLFARLPVVGTPELTSDARIRAALWHLRKGLFAAVAGARPSGTTALLEDIAVPVARLADTCAGLQALFATHGYGDAVIFGHAKDGNVHFLLNERFDDPASLQRYIAFTDDMVDLVLAAGGTLKAEHGTGRIMAPFVRRQYGDDLFAMMVELKRAFDPAGILSPGIVVSDDPGIHLQHLKSTPTVEAEVDRCVECGYCEPVCPSKDLTVTPRQRIVVRRAIADAVARGDLDLARELERQSAYEVEQTCAVDGMCATACPVFINTGDLVRRLRAESVAKPVAAAWTAAGRHWDATTRLASTALSVVPAVAPLVPLPNRAARAVLGADTVPEWSRDLPRGGARRRAGVTGAPEIVYFAACVGTMFGPAEGGEGVAVAFESLLVKAGIGAVRPEGVGDLCCGTPWKSKGITEGYAEMVDRTVASLWEASRHGELPVVCDNSSCSEGLVHALEKAVASDDRYSGLRILDAVDFAAEHLLPVLDVSPVVGRLAVHPTCSSTRAGSNPHLMAVAGAVATEAVVPDDWGCCAFAGDRGMLHPELTASATAREAEAVRAGHFDAHASCNRTCEIGMTRATGAPYQHVLELLDAASSPKEN